MRYTVVGYYRDNNQRWADEIEARSPEAAEREAASKGIAVCAVLVIEDGGIVAVDQETYVG